MPLIIFSCNSNVTSNETLNIEEFKSIYQLSKGERILDQDFGYGIYSVDSILLVKQKSADTSRNLYNVYAKDLNYLGSVGKYGAQAPNDFIGASFSGQLVNDSSDLSIVINDFPKSRVSVLNISKSLDFDSTIIDYSIKYHPKYDFSGNIFFGKKSFILGRQGGMGFETNREQFHILEENGGELKSYGDYPMIVDVDDPKSELYNYVNDSYLAMRPDGSRFASVLFYYDQLTIFDSSGKVIRTVKTEKFKRYRESEIIFDDNIMNDLNIFYRSIHVSAKYIYALIYDQPKSELSKKHIPVSIRVFDWDGNLKGILKSEEYLTHISVDEESGLLYADYYEEQSILKYDIKPFLISLE
jgi:hypothetical protein